MASKEISSSDPFLKAVFMNMEEAKIDWQKVAEQCGISYGKNAKRRFNDAILKPLNLKYMGSHITPLDDTQSADIVTTPVGQTRRASSKQSVGPRKTPKPAIKRREYPRKKVEIDNDCDEPPQEATIKGEDSIEVDN